MAANGKAGEPQAAASNGTAAERDGQGRFVGGNGGGPGNPYARRVGELRRAMLAAVSEEDLAAIMRALVDRAKEGNVQAAKVVLSYALGKPQPAADPDREDVEEWNLHQETAGMMKTLPQVAKAPPAHVPLGTARLLRPLMGSMLSRKMADMLLHPEEHFPDWDTKAETAEEPSTNGFFGESAELKKGREEIWKMLQERGAAGATT